MNALAVWQHSQHKGTLYFKQKVKKEETQEWEWEGGEKEGWQKKQRRMWLSKMCRKMFLLSCSCTFTADNKPADVTSSCTQTPLCFAIMANLAVQSFLCCLLNVSTMWCSDRCFVTLFLGIRLIFKCHLLSFTRLMSLERNILFRWFRRVQTEPRLDSILSQMLPLVRPGFYKWVNTHMYETLFFFFFAWSVIILTVTSLRVICSSFRDSVFSCFHRLSCVFWDLSTRC